MSPTGHVEFSTLLKSILGLSEDNDFINYRLKSSHFKEYIYLRK